MTKFTFEHKIDVVVRYQSQFESVREIARSIGANPEVVRMWIKQFEYPRISRFRKTLYISHNAV